MLARGPEAGRVLGEGEDVGALDEAIERRSDLRGRTQRRRPLVEAEVGGNHEGAAPVAAGHHLEEDAGEILLDLAWAVAELVQDDKIKPGDLGQKVVERVIGQGGIEAAQELVGAEEADPIAGLAGAHAHADREMGLAHAARPDPQDRLAAVEEAELGQIEDALSVERRLLLEVVVFEPADLGEAGLPEPLVGGGLAPGQDLRLGDAGQKGQVAELELGRLAQVVIEVLGGVAQTQTAEVLDQSVSLFGRHEAPGWAARTSKRRGCAGGCRRP